MRVAVLGSSRWTTANVTDEITTARTADVRRSQRTQQQAPEQELLDQRREQGDPDHDQDQLGPAGVLHRVGRLLLVDAAGYLLEQLDGPDRDDLEQDARRPATASPGAAGPARSPDAAVPSPLVRLDPEQGEQDRPVLCEQRDREVQAVRIEAAPPPSGGRGDRIRRWRRRRARRTRPRRTSPSPHAAPDGVDSALALTFGNLTVDTGNPRVPQVVVAPETATAGDPPYDGDPTGSSPSRTRSSTPQ